MSKPFYALEVDYEQAKRDYLKMVEQEFNFTRNCSRRVYEFHTKTNIDNMIAQKLANPRGFRNYEVMQGPEGKPILVAKQKTLTMRSIQVLSWDDIFDLIMPLHVKSGHRGQNFLGQELTHLDKNFAYRYPKQVLAYFKRVCNICQQNSGFLHMKFLKTSLVYLVPMSLTRPVETFRYLMIYLDQQTTYIILRPLKAKDHLEIAAELYKIFNQFGPPVRLIMRGYNPVLTEKVKKVLDEICQRFNIEVEHQPPSYEIPAIVNNGIEEWMSSTKSQAWEVGCFIVQTKLNNDHQMAPSIFHLHRNITPHSLFFHTGYFDQNLFVLYNRATKSSDHQHLVRDRNRTTNIKEKSQDPRKKNDKVLNNETNRTKPTNNNQPTEPDQIPAQDQNILKQSTELPKSPRRGENQTTSHQIDNRESVIHLNLPNNFHQSKNTDQQNKENLACSEIVIFSDQSDDSNGPSLETRTNYFTLNSDDIAKTNNLITISDSTNQSSTLDSTESQFAISEPIDQSCNHKSNIEHPTNKNVNFNVSTTKTQTTYLNKHINYEYSNVNQLNIQNKEPDILVHRPNSTVQKTINTQHYTISLIDSDEETQHVNVSNYSDINNAKNNVGQIFKTKVNNRRKSRNEYRRFSDDN